MVSILTQLLAIPLQFLRFLIYWHVDRFPRFRNAIITYALVIPLLFLVLAAFVSGYSWTLKIALIDIEMITASIFLTYLTIRNFVLGTEVASVFSLRGRSSRVWTFGEVADVAGTGALLYIRAASAVLASEIAVGIIILILPAHANPWLAILMLPAAFCIITYSIWQGGVFWWALIVLASGIAGFVLPVVGLMFPESTQVVATAAVGVDHTLAISSPLRGVIWLGGLATTILIFISIISERPSIRQGVLLFATVLTFLTLLDWVLFGGSFWQAFYLLAGVGTIAAILIPQFVGRSELQSSLLTGVALSLLFLLGYQLIWGGAEVVSPPTDPPWSLVRVILTGATLFFASFFFPGPAALRQAARALAILGVVGYILYYPKALVVAAIPPNTWAVMTGSNVRTNRNLCQPDASGTVECPRPNVSDFEDLVQTCISTGQTCKVDYFFYLGEGEDSPTFPLSPKVIGSYRFCYERIVPQVEMQEYCWDRDKRLFPCEQATPSHVVHAAAVNATEKGGNYRLIYWVGERRDASCLG